MNDHGKSDRLIVPGKSPNKAAPAAAEVVEGRGLAKGNVAQQNTPRTQSRIGCVPSALDRVRRKADAERFHAELRERLANFALEMHPEKTRLIEFGRFAESNRLKHGLGKPETFDFLGLTHICGKSRAGKFMLRRHTNRKRMSARLKQVKASLMRRRHLSVPAQGKWLRAVVRGYFAYHAVPTNTRAIAAFYKQVQRHWLRALRRRSQRDRTDWARLKRLSRRWLPKPRILHPWPQQRFGVTTRGRSPVR